MVCPACATELGEGTKFCPECGAAVQAPRCPSCGTPHALGQKFCSECGTGLANESSATAAESGATRSPAPEREVVQTAPELRLVSVLFVDLVGYTSLSESRDAEEVRDLLGSYFESTRTIVDRYGGTVEKFIGDAVMAVWGTPIAREDDAERAVRAGLEILGAVTAFGDEVGVPGLRARAGVVTGQVASLANPGEGLVVGDRVNTASRAQSAAEPGTLAVDDVTHEVTSAAIAYEDAGEHAVKGKTEPIHLWRAVRVIAGRGGAQRERGIEAPLIGRDADLRLLKELFHGALERRAARLVTVYGAAGVGKTRLLWEFDKYADGLAEGILWHSGRCLSYGDGVAYWALAEMLRQRFGIPEEAPVEEIRSKLEAGLERWVPDPADRDFLWPRLGVLLGVAEPGLGRSELFAGWRLFLERLADHLPVVLVFDDLQWADEGMLDFIEHMLEWSAESPIFMLTLARPEMSSGREGWPGGRRGASVLQLEPLDFETMGELLDELVEGLPRQVRGRMIDRAEGVPLYAIETIRALANRGVLEHRDERLTLTGELGELDVPASLGSLLAARLDALEPLERRFMKAMAVFGTSFSRASAVELGDVPEERIDEILEALVRKQVLAIRADPLTPDSGHYVFVQGLLRTVAYEMLSRRERKPRHLAAAAHLRQLFPHDGEDVAAEAIASHYLDAHRAAGPRDPDEPALRATTIAALRRAAGRAASVGAPESAERAYRTAIELARDEDERTDLTTAAGEMALAAGRLEHALELLKEAAAAQLAAGREREAASVAGNIGRALSYLGRNDQAIEQITGALEILGADRVDAEVARLHAVLGHALLYGGNDEQAGAPLETALRFAQELALPEVQSGALIDKGLMCLQDNRPDEARALLGAALEIAERNELIDRAHNALGNSGMLGMQWDQPGADRQFGRALALARRLGDRFRESISAGNLMYLHVFAGRWNEIDTMAPGLLEELEDRPGVEYVHWPLAVMHTLRGDLDGARANLEGMVGWELSDDEDLGSTHTSVAISIALTDGRPQDALELGLEMLPSATSALGASHDAVRHGWSYTLEAAIGLGRGDAAAGLLALLEEQPPGHVPPFLRAQLSRGHGLIAAAAGDRAAAEPLLLKALDAFLALDYPYWVARARIEVAECLAGQSRVAEAAELLAQAISVLEVLGAEPALARARTVLGAGERAPAVPPGPEGAALSA
jgi:class 3 adenylate cyclase/tetratricopeptide (TPR) repeat protein